MTPLLRCLLALLVLPLMIGCESLSPMLDSALRSAPKPTATIKDVRFGDLSTKGLTLNFDVDVTNPYRLPLPVAALEYGLTASGGTAPFVSGAMTDPAIVPAGSSGRFAVPVRVGFAELLSAVKGARPGTMIPYTAQLDLMASVPGTGEALRLPLGHSGELPVPAPPKVTVEGVSWDQIGLNGAKGAVKLGVMNPNAFAVDLTALKYGVKLAGSEVLKGTTGEPLALAAGSGQTLALPFEIGGGKLGLAALNTIRGGDVAFELNGDVTVKTPFGSFTESFKEQGKAPSRK